MADPGRVVVVAAGFALWSGGRCLAAARTLETAFARRDGVVEIAALVDEVIGEHSTAARR